MVTVGVTGGLGAGKSTACEFLREKGACIFNADDIAKEILSTNAEVQDAISAAFGPGIIVDDRIDNRRLAQQAFLNEEHQTTLNNILHPHVIAAFEKKAEELASQTGLLVVDAPLIFESGFDSHLDHTVLIYTTFKIRLARAMRRGTLSREDILRRIQLQMPEEDKRELATHVIENNGTAEQLREAMYALYDQLMG